MSLSFLHRLRRCRVLFALALCAWLMMGSAAWAKADCCASTGMQGMASMHGGGQAPQPPHHHADTCQCTCSHMTVDLSALQALPRTSIMPGQTNWQAGIQMAPQPAYAPPLRPPAV
jgi:hypothetical protein